MKISTKGRYGVAAMYDLAINYGQGPISLRSIAERQKISESYLEQLVSTLRKAGYVKSIRGAQGGYTLSKDPAQISVGDIVRIMEGPITLVDCLLEHSTDHDCCEREDICVTRDVWAKVSDSINRVVDSISLADLCREEKLRGDVCDNEKSLF